jgi:hypothetical protein
MPHRVELAIGLERTLDEVNRTLRDVVHNWRAPVVGAMHITCADESEWECIDAFQRRIVDRLLPDLKYARKACFHLSNLGARYEAGALPVAEHHYATPEARDSFKVMLVKINGHVAVTGEGDAAQFGQMERYESTSTACGALHALLAGKQLPALTELAAAFRMDDHDRLAMLRDAATVPTKYRSLFAAVVSARLQARRVERAVAEHQAHSPTVYIIAPAVTLNRAEADTEILLGVGVADQRDPHHVCTYQGLGDDPSRYAVRADAAEHLEIYEPAD